MINIKTNLNNLMITPYSSEYRVILNDVVLVYIIRMINNKNNLNNLKITPNSREYRVILSEVVLVYIIRIITKCY